jgi:hypothetical protein
MPVAVTHADFIEVDSSFIPETPDNRGLGFFLGQFRWRMPKSSQAQLNHFSVVPAPRLQVPHSLC